MSTRFTLEEATRAIVDNIYNDSDSENDMLAAEFDESSDEENFSDKVDEDTSLIAEANSSSVELNSAASFSADARPTQLVPAARVQTTTTGRRVNHNKDKACQFQQENFNWTDKKNNVWSGTLQPVDSPTFLGTPDYKRPTGNLASPLEWCKLFLTVELIEIFIRETNRYASQYIAKQTAAGNQLSDRVRRWKDVTVDELWTFLGIFIATGIVRKGRLADYWSTDDVLDTPYFRNHMSRNRFQSILRFFHFTDNENLDKDDKLAKIRPVYDLLCSLFTSNYTPNQHLALDEGMLAWRGRLKFKVYNPMKPDKYGIKGYIVSEASSGYLWRYDMYCGGGVTLQDRVSKLLEPAKGKNYFVYMDNFYNSVSLLQRLRVDHIYSAGTLRGHRGQPPMMEKEGKIMKRGQNIFAFTGDILVHYWFDKRLVKTISNFHPAEMRDSGKLDRKGMPVMKPATVLEYNKYMNGVDKSDQMGNS